MARDQLCGLQVSAKLNRYSCLTFSYAYLSYSSIVSAKHISRPAAGNMDNTSMPSSSAKLFQPIQIGNITLDHRLVLAPLTRLRANKAHVHGDMAVEYYSQRASTPGTLLITEGTFIAAKAGGYSNVPGIYTQDQIDAWKRVRTRYSIDV